MKIYMFDVLSNRLTVISKEELHIITNTTFKERYTGTPRHIFNNILERRILAYRDIVPLALRYLRRHYPEDLIW